jgi:hypothetical protein
MSPRAAARLERLGFGETYDYVGSKMEWIGEDLPFEGALAQRPRLSTLAERDVPTCRIDDTVARVRGGIGSSELCVVVDGPQRIVVGLVRAAALGMEDDRVIEDVMQEGPSTYRPHVTAVEMAENLDRAPLPWVLVSTASGSLIGLARPDAIRAAAEADHG